MTTSYYEMLYDAVLLNKKLGHYLVIMEYFTERNKIDKGSNF